MWERKICLSAFFFFFFTRLFSLALVKKIFIFQCQYYPNARIKLNAKTSEMTAKWNSCFPASSGPEEFCVCGGLEREVSSQTGKVWSCCRTLGRGDVWFPGWARWGALCIRSHTAAVASAVSALLALALWFVCWIGSQTRFSSGLPRDFIFHIEQCISSVCASVSYLWEFACMRHQWTPLSTGVILTWYNLLSKLTILRFI